MLVYQRVARKNQVSINKNVDSLLIHDGFLMVSVGTQYTTYLLYINELFHLGWIYLLKYTRRIKQQAGQAGGFLWVNFVFSNLFDDAMTYIIIYGFVQNVISYCVE